MGNPANIARQRGNAVLMALFMLVGVLAAWGMMDLSPVKIAAILLGLLCMVLAAWRIEEALFVVAFALVVLQEGDTTPGTVFAFLEWLNRPNIPSLLEALFAVLAAAFFIRYILIHDGRYSLAGLKVPLALFFLLLIMAHLNGLTEGTDPTFRKEDFKRFVFPVLVFVCSLNILDSREKITRLLGMMFWVMLAKSYLAAFYYLKGMGFPYDEQQVVFIESGDQTLVVTIIVAGVALLARQKLGVKSCLFMLWGLAPMLFALIFSYRRNALLGTLLSLGLLLVLSENKQKVKLLKMFSAVAVCVFGLMTLRPVTNAASTGEFLKNRLSSVLSQDESSNVAHRNEWNNALRDTMQRPLFGLGLGSEHSQDPEFPSINLHTVHNALLMLWMKMGLFAILLFFWCLYRYCRLGVREALRHHDPLLTGLFVTVGLWAVAMNVSPSWFYYRESCLMALIMAVVGRLALLGPAQLAAAARQEERPRAPLARKVQAVTLPPS